ncbi:MAG: transporter [Chloroflexi bacterium]|nr:transporter [Chloroflexota bacterium]
MIELLRNDPLLLLFVVAAIGYLVGRIEIHGIGLGVAAVLFVGIVIGGLDPELKLPDLVYELGLVLFVYTVGLSSGPGFFASFRHKGLYNLLFVLSILALAFGLALLIRWLFQLTPALTAGIFAGSLTNTPALATTLDYIRANAAPDVRTAMLNEPVIGYSVTYPMGVIAMILALSLFRRFFSSRQAAGMATPESPSNFDPHLYNRTIRITRPLATTGSIQELMAQYQWNIVFGRLRHDGHLQVVTPQTRFAMGDLVTVVGASVDLEQVTTDLGEVSQEQLNLDRSELDFRRIFVSNSQLAGKRVRDLNLSKQYGAIITRVRRGDVEFLVQGDTVLELGDRVRVLTRRENLKQVGEFFGDSYRALSEIDVVTLGLGLALGLLVGLVPIPLPGGVTLTLGIAGGPLLVALVLGALGRTGSLVWSMPYSANQVLRQMGLVFFLAGVGTRSGYAFFSTLMTGGWNGGLAIFIAGLLITTVIALATLTAGYFILKLPLDILTGALAGIQTQPAVLGFALAQTDNDQPNVGYASVYPMALIGKILFAQFLMLLLR